MIHLRKCVTQINWKPQNNSRKTVSCDDGSEYLADHIIVTIPLGVLKER